ncbi:hypothetical protein EPYR_01196 [Erwinia pyrifoliae DSM 12163]|nr:hypothetical protein EJP617_35650 [Erwinia sp. Ejp617]CAY73576.1 hypothetical protein EPYR_01196 [Erwinia pyrifoliae DSM 12163]
MPLFLAHRRHIESGARQISSIIQYAAAANYSTCRSANNREEIEEIM